NPDDDTPRLVYADYLDERGDLRGEFIRTQIALARLPDDDPRRPELEARERGLLGEHGEEWARPLRPWVTGWTFCRGFIEMVTVAPDAYLEHIANLRLHAPLRHVEVDLTGVTVVPAVVELIPLSVAWENVVFPFGQKNGKLMLAVRDMTDAF